MSQETPEVELTDDEILDVAGKLTAKYRSPTWNVTARAFIAAHKAKQLELPKPVNPSKSFADSLVTPCPVCGGRVIVPRPIELEQTKVKPLGE